MSFRILALALSMISTVAYAQGRAPAVEDFVGIEVEQADTIPHGSESLYNLEQDMNRLETIQIKAMNTPKQSAPQTFSEVKPWSMGSILGITFVLGLPLLSWLLVMNHMRRRATTENASNIAVLEQYRRDREQSKKKIEDIRKVS